MKSSTLASAAMLAMGVKASTFTLLAARSASPVHLQPIEANDSGFWIGKNASSYCPAGTQDCPDGKTTTFDANDSDGGAALAVEVPGGQQIFVTLIGELSFTEAHSHAIPTDAYTSGFKYTAGAPDSQGSFTFTGHGATGFIACPAASPTAFPWKIFVDLPTLTDDAVPSGNKADCLGFDTLAEPAKGPGAYQYE